MSNSKIDGCCHKIGIMKEIVRLYDNCKSSRTSFAYVVSQYMLIYLIHKKKIFPHPAVSIYGFSRIRQSGYLQIGTRYVGFQSNYDRTMINVRGELVLQGKFYIGRGCRFDIGSNATVIIGPGGYINNNTKIIIMHKLIIGSDCAISWECQFLDEDFHEIEYKNKQTAERGIEIGNHVWIGSNSKIYKGTRIPDGCVVASDSVVKSVFTKQNCLIGGNPARVLVEDIFWK